MSDKRTQDTLSKVFVIWAAAASIASGAFVAIRTPGTIAHGLLAVASVFFVFASFIVVSHVLAYLLELGDYSPDREGIDIDADNVTVVNRDVSGYGIVLVDRGGVVELHNVDSDGESYQRVSLYPDDISDVADELSIRTVEVKTELERLRHD